MKEFVCQVLKGLFVTGWLCVAPQEAQAVTHTISTAAQLTNCLNGSCPAGQSLSCGDTINLTAGTYSADTFDINSKNCCPSSPCSTPIIIQASGWTAVGAGTEDRVFIEGATTPSESWVACTGLAGACDGVCSGLPATVPCGNVFHLTSTSSLYSQVHGMKRSDGGTTYSVNSLGDMTNSHSNFNNKRCSGTNDQWRACSTNSDCPSGQTCSVTVSEIDSYRNIALNRIFVNMGSTTAPSGATLYYTNNGNGFRIQNSTGITIRGLIFRHHRRAAIVNCQFDNIPHPERNCPHTSTRNGNFMTYQDNEFWYSKDNEGSDYSIASISANNVVIDSNEIAYMGSELHTEGRINNDATVYTVSNNWVHNIGDAKVMGPSYASNTRQNTPDGFIFGENNGGPGTGNYTGSKFYGNLVENLPNNTASPSANSSGIGIILENDCDGWEIYNNIFRETGGEAIKCSATGTNAAASCSSHQIYNNIFVRNGTNPGGGSFATMLFTSSGSNPVANTSVFNNTFYDSNIYALKYETGPSNATGNIFRNNIFYDANGLLIDWAPTSTTNKFQNNLMYSTNSPIVTISGTSYDCTGIASADFDASGADDDNKCENPGFYSPSDFLFYPTGGSFSNTSQFLSNSQFGGPAIDMGTATGMPAGKTTGIVNTLAFDHGFGFYDDSVSLTGSAWDAGAVEAYIGYGGRPLLVAASGPWTEFKPSATCSGLSSSGPMTVGGNDGIILTTQKDPAILCSGVSQPLTLTVGQDYLVQVELRNVRDQDGLDCDGSTPPICSDNGLAVSCILDSFDNWAIDATNATLTLLKTFATGRCTISNDLCNNDAECTDTTPGDTCTITPSRGVWATGGVALTGDTARQYRLTPTSTSVTLKLQAPASATFTSCPDLAYTFSPIILFPEP